MKRGRGRLAFLALAVATFSVFSTALAQNARMIAVGTDVRLEVVDWGGRGPTLVFLAGLGNTAHVFDGFAPQFTDRFRVLGITRRGYGSSAGAIPANDLDTLVRDITAVLDSLRLSKVVLVGHSIAGDEMTHFGVTMSGRCSGLIYLDAAYDRSQLGSVYASHPPPPPPVPLTRADSSVAAGEAIARRNTGALAFPGTEIRATGRFNRDSLYVGPVTPDSLNARVIAAIRKPAWSQVHCRSLGIYAAPSSTSDVVPWFSFLDPAARARADSFATAQRTSPYGTSADAFRRVRGNEVVELIGGTHYIFLQKPKEVARAMRLFLSR